MEKLISIITVSFNEEKTIERTIKSVLSQKTELVEYIVIDGASTDRTMSIIQRYKDSIDKIISEPDSGIYNAMNKGIKLAIGKYIAFLNANDWYEDNALSTIIKEMQSFEYDVYHGLIRIWNENIKYQIRGATVDMMPNEMPAHPSCFIKRDLYLKYLFDEQYKSAADYDFMFKIYKDNTFCFIEKIIANFGLGGISSSNTSYTETLRIQYRHGFISRKQYLRTICRCKLRHFLKRLLKR